MTSKKIISALLVLTAAASASLAQKKPNQRIVVVRQYDLPVGDAREWVLDTFRAPGFVVTAIRIRSYEDTPINGAFAVSFYVSAPWYTQTISDPGWVTIDDPEIYFDCPIKDEKRYARAIIRTPYPYGADLIANVSSPANPEQSVLVEVEGYSL